MKDQLKVVFSDYSIYKSQSDMKCISNNFNTQFPIPPQDYSICKHELTYHHIDESTLMNLVSMAIIITLTTLSGSSFILSALL